MSGDKANDGEPEQFELWSRGDGASTTGRRSPGFAGVGNHDRDRPTGIPGRCCPPSADFDAYARVLRRPPLPDGRRAPATRPAIQPDATRRRATPPAPPRTTSPTSADVRWVFIDNSCWCDHRSAIRSSIRRARTRAAARPSSTSSRRVGSAGVGRRQARVRRHAHADARPAATSSTANRPRSQHTMGKAAGGVLDNNACSSRRRADAGVDGVFLGHIKGQFLYTGAGRDPVLHRRRRRRRALHHRAGRDRPRLLARLPADQRPRRRASSPTPSRSSSPAGSRSSRPESGSAGRVERDVRGLRPPAGVQRPGEGAGARAARPGPDPALGSRRASAPGSRAGGRGSLLAPAGRRPRCSRGSRRWRRARRRLAVPALIGAVGLLGCRRRLGRPAGRADLDPGRVAAEPGADVDELEARRCCARSPRRPTTPAATRAGRPPTAASAPLSWPGSRLTIASGFEHASAGITVPSAKGPIVDSIRGAREVIRAGKRARVARVELDQRARVVARVTRGGRKVATPEAVVLACRRGRGQVEWEGGAQRQGPGGSGPLPHPGQGALRSKAGQTRLRRSPATLSRAR